MHMLPPSSKKIILTERDFELGLRASHHLKNNPPKGRIPKRWDKNPVQEILPEGRIINRVLLIEGYLHVSTFYSEENLPTPKGKSAPFQEWHFQAQTAVWKRAQGSPEVHCSCFSWGPKSNPSIQRLHLGTTSHHHDNPTSNA